MKTMLVLAACSVALAMLPIASLADNPDRRLQDQTELIFDPVMEENAGRLLEKAAWTYERDIHSLGYPIVEVGLVSKNADDELLTALEPLPRLRYVFTWYFTPTQVLRLTKLRQLESLRIDGAKFGMQEVTALSRTPRLRDLTFWNCNFEGMDALKELATSPRLQELNLYRCRGITDEDVKKLSQLKCLIKLGILEGHITDAAMDELANWPNLRSLCLSDTALTNSGLQKLARSKSLTILDLSATKVSDDGLAALARLSTLRDLDIAFCDHVTKDGVTRFKAALPSCKINGP